MHGRNAALAHASVAEAAQGCDVVNVVYERYHVHRWRRLPPFTNAKKEQRRPNHALPLLHVGRSACEKGTNGFSLPAAARRWQSPPSLPRHEGLLVARLDVGGPCPLPLPDVVLPA